MSDSRQIKTIKKSERKPEHPLSSAFGHSLGGLLIVARLISKDYGKDAPQKIKDFLEMFDKKTA